MHGSGRKIQAKKTPVGDRGVRVIVVVANSVSVLTPSGGGFLLLSLGYSYFCLLLFFLFPLTSGFDVCKTEFESLATQKPFLCAC